MCSSLRTSWAPTRVNARRDASWASRALPCDLVVSAMASGGPKTPPRSSTSLLTLLGTPGTPRRRKQPQPTGLHGTKDLTGRLKPTALRGRLKDALNLKFEPDPWQLEVISRVLRGFDAVVCAGTGYGKSLVFEGLAVLGGKKKVVVVISPLKALEKDQVRQL